MNIPKTVKLGGKTFTVEITNNLVGGAIQCSAEVDYLNLDIRVAPNAQQRMEADFLHEIIHAIYDNMGCEQNEQHIEQLAESLYALIQDNPKMFERGNKK